MKLTVDRLAKSFGAVHAVRDVGFEVAAGTMLALIGPNGAGKCTCFQCVNVQLEPDHGVVRLDGVDITHSSVSARARMGM